MKKVVLAFCAVLSFVSSQAQEATFGQKIGKLMELATAEPTDNTQIRGILKTLAIAPKEMQEAAMDYSIYDNFEGDTLYYIPYLQADEPRFSVEKLKQKDKLFYTMQFLISSSYTKNQKGEVSYTDPAYLYNATIEELMPYCTTPMTYKNGKGNNPESPLLSCVYTNPNSKRRLMYWVVCDEPIGKKEGNRIKEIKIQSIELWR